MAAQEAWTEAQRILRSKERIGSLQRYISDPVAFGKELLHDQYTDGSIKVFESVRDNMVTIARSANSVGKSFTAARIAIWYYRVFEDAQVYLTAAPPLDNLRRILWGEIMKVVQHYPNLFLGDRLRAMSIARSARSFITGVAIPTSGSSEEREAKFNGKHAPHLLFIVDEGDAVPDEVYKGIEACMSGGHARLLIMFNPRMAAGSVYQKEINRQANVIELSALEHPNVKTGFDVIPGAVTRDTTVRRINTWTRPLMINEKVEADCFEVPNFLVGSTARSFDGREYPAIEAGLRKITDPSFSYMVLGRYPAQADDQLISQAWIDNARSRYDAYVAMYGEVPPEGVQPIMGVDIAEYGVDANIACLRYGNWVAPLITWRGVDIVDSANRALEIYREKSCSLAMIDGTGVGSGVAPTMARNGREDDVRAISVKVSAKPTNAIKTDLGEFFSLRDQLWWAVREWLRTDQGAMLPPDRILVEDLRTPMYSIRENGRIKITSKDTMRDLLRRSPDRGDALCLTFSPFRRAEVIRLDM